MSRKRSGKDTEIQEFRHRDTTNVEHESVTMPVIIGAIRTVTNVLNNNLKAVPRNIQ